MYAYIYNNIVIAMFLNKKIAVSNMAKFSKKIKYLPLILGIFLFAFILINFHDITAEEIVAYTPNNYLLAFLMMMGIFAIKSLSIFIPLPVLYVSSTLIFTSRWAVLVNLFGLLVTMTLPYVIGKYSASQLVEGVFEKYPKISRINDIKTDKDFVFSFIIKLMGFIPNDISSLFLGSVKVNYMKFLAASVLVRMPVMLFVTLTGLNFLNDEETSLLLIGVILILSLITLYLFFRKYKEELK